MKCSILTFDFHMCALHTATAPAVQAAVKTSLSFRNDTIIAIVLCVNIIGMN